MKWEVGHTGWEVEWCTAIPIDPETGDGDIDNATYKTKLFRDKTEAKKFAESVYPEDQWGSVALSPIQIEYVEPDHPRCDKRVGYTGDSEGFAGQWDS